MQFIIIKFMYILKSHTFTTLEWEWPLCIGEYLIIYTTTILTHTLNNITNSRDSDNNNCYEHC